MKNPLVDCRTFFFLALFLFSCNQTKSDQNQSNHNPIHQALPDGLLPVISNVEAQPFLAQASRISEALDFIGNPLPKNIDQALRSLHSQSHSAESVKKIQELLDPFCLAMIEINPESRVKAQRGSAPAIMVQEGWTTYLLKVHNQAKITAKLEAESPQSLPLLNISSGDHRMKPANYLSPGEVDNRFLEMAIYRNRPLQSQLSGLEVEYVPIQFYTKATGKKEVTLGFNVGQGTQDIGFRNTIDVLFDIKPSVKVVLKVKDEDGSPTMGSFIITDGIERNADRKFQRWGGDYRLNMASTEHWQENMNEKQKEAIQLPKKRQLIGVFPLPARRLATKDEYPDFFFQPQVYRYDGEHVYLPSGDYHITYGRGPEYYTKYQKLHVPPGKETIQAQFKLERWIHMSKLSWYSGDHHIHAAGCSHYESPAEGVLPEHMWRQVLGEDLNMGSNLTWGPSWYHQKQYFTGKNHPLSNDKNILRYDIEVSGFPSSHSGHIVLLNLKEDDYPNTSRVEEWPTWTLPVLEWAKSQGGITGYAHSGWGLAPIKPTNELPNYVVPKMDGIGANEYIVTVAHRLIDFFSAGDTPAPYELNMWYHTLNCGFKVRISGETDFPCISDEKVGLARIYAELKNGLDFNNYMEALVEGRSYVSDGYSHLIDFRVNGQKLGENNSELKVKGKSNLTISVKAAAFLPEVQDIVGKTIASLSLEQSPYWNIERSRIGESRKVPVELIVNGISVQKQELIANGNWQSFNFNYSIEKSAWVAVRIYPSAHTNPIFVEMDGMAINEKKSAEWCRAAVDQCWEQKNKQFRKEELLAAKKGYDHARMVYDKMILEGE